MCDVLQNALTPGHHTLTPGHQRTVVQDHIALTPGHQRAVAVQKHANVVQAWVTKHHPSVTDHHMDVATQKKVVSTEHHAKKSGLQKKLVHHEKCRTPISASHSKMCKRHTRT